MNIQRFSDFIKNTNEGLISTADLNTVVDVMSRWFNEHLPHQVDMTTGDGHRLFIRIDVPSGKSLSNKQLDFFNKMDMLGYYLADADADFHDAIKPTPAKSAMTVDEIKKKVKKWKGGGEYADEEEYEQFQFMFEPKFQSTVGADKKFLYHIASGDTINKIMRVGLVPKTKSKLSFHPDRVYLGELTMMEPFFTVYRRYVQNPALLKVDVSGIKLSYDWNVVPSKHAYFTSSNIAPSRITVELRDMDDEGKALKAYIKKNKQKQ